MDDPYKENFLFVLFSRFRDNLAPNSCLYYSSHNFDLENFHNDSAFLGSAQYNTGFYLNNIFVLAQFVFVNLIRPWWLSGQSHESSSTDPSSNPAWGMYLYGTINVTEMGSNKKAVVVMSRKWEIPG